MSGADVLTRAASRLRELAEVPWQSFPPRVEIDREEEACDVCGETKRLVASYPDSNHEPWLCAECASEVDFAAAMSPDVALGMADWLDWVALFVAAMEDEEWHDLDGDPIAPEDTHAIGSALRVARAVLREDT